MIRAKGRQQLKAAAQAASPSTITTLTPEEEQKEQGLLAKSDGGYLDDGFWCAFTLSSKDDTMLFDRTRKLALRHNGLVTVERPWGEDDLRVEITIDFLAEDIANGNMDKADKEVTVLWKENGAPLHNSSEAQTAAAGK